MAGLKSMNFVICSLPQILGLSNKGGGMGRSCSMHRRDDKWTKISVAELEGKYNFKTMA